MKSKDLLMFSQQFDTEPLQFTSSNHISDPF